MLAGLVWHQGGGQLRCMYVCDDQINTCIYENFVLCLSVCIYDSVHVTFMCMSGIFVCTCVMHRYAAIICMWTYIHTSDSHTVSVLLPLG